MNLQHSMDVGDAERDPGYESRLTCKREGHLIEVKEEKDPLSLTYSEFVAENEVSCTSSPSEMWQRSNSWEWQLQIKTMFLKIVAAIDLRIYCLHSAVFIFKAVNVQQCGFCVLGDLSV
jgi:hypothetical protein